MLPFSLDIVQKMPIQTAQAFRTTVAGIETDVSVTVDNFYATMVDFHLHGRAYHFSIDAWRGRGIQKLLTFFHGHVTRDPANYGALVESDNGNREVRMTIPQRVNAVVQAVKDIMTCFEMIFQAHQRSIVDYAIWYREHGPRHETYSHHITKIACNCIIHSNFMAPDVVWNLVEF